MAMPSNNLFLRLHKWASRQDENYHTESLAVLLEQLLVLAPAVGKRLVAGLTNNLIGGDADDASAIEIRTQIEAESGRPDLKIRAVDRLAWIEVKVEAEVDQKQLEKYLNELAEHKVKNNKLVLLTRYSVELPPKIAERVYQVRWFEVADWLEKVLVADSVCEAAGFLVAQFLDFLEARSMKISQVGKSMPEGTRALSNFKNMLQEAALACLPAVKPWSGWDLIGVKLERGRYQACLNFSNPNTLWFETRCRIDPERAVKLGLRELGEESWIPGRFYWWKGVELDSEEHHFFSLSKADQMQWLIDFLQDGLSKARSIETPDQPPLPEEPEEG